MPQDIPANGPNTTMQQNVNAQPPQRTPTPPADDSKTPATVNTKKAEGAQPSKTTAQTAREATPRHKKRHHRRRHNRT